MNLFAGEPDYPLLPLPTQAEVDALLRAVGPDEAFARIQNLLASRRATIARAELDPVRCAPRPKPWRIARRLMASGKAKVLVLLGGNRSTKSYCSAYWTLEEALAITTAQVAQNEGVTFLVMSESQESSRATAQKIIWSLLPKAYKDLNGKRSSTTYIHHSIKEGFSDDIVVLPSGVEIKFATYNQDPDDWEGRELGLKNRPGLAWWADENMPLPWFLMLQRRGRYRPGWGVWSFTPIHGITPTIKEAVGMGRVRRTRAAKLLPAEQVLVPGLRPGRVPFIQDGADELTRVCYFHSDLTPFRSGDRLYSELVAEQVKGKTKAYTLAVYYGFTLDVAGRAWPKYSRQVHQCRVADLPWNGTNYVFIDPAGGRSWFILWVRVAPGNPRRLYVYRDYPDKRRFGEWAVPTVRQLGADSRKGRDGDKGPAQRNPGGGVERYKRVMLVEEVIDLRLAKDGAWAMEDPQHRHLANRAMRESGAEPVEEIRGLDGMVECRWKPEQVEEYRKQATEPLREEIRLRFIDPRAGGAPQASAKGGTTIITMFADEQRRADGVLEGPRMMVRPAYSGRDQDEGIRAVNELLDYDDESPVVPILNEPNLMVCDRCEQIDWVLTHFTGEGAEDDGGKDPADLLRYMALTEEVRHVGAGGVLVTGGFKEGIS